MRSLVAQLVLQKRQDRVVARAQWSGSVDLGQLLPDVVGLGPLVLLLVQLLELHQRVPVLGIEPQHFLERLVRAVDETAAAKVQAEAQQDVGVLERLEVLALQQALVDVDGAAHLALLAIEVAQHEMDLEGVLVEPRGTRQLVDGLIDLVGDDQVEPDDEVWRLARLAAIDPLAVAQLVPLPGLADGQAGEQGHQGDEHRQVDGHGCVGAGVHSATSAFQRSCDLSTISVSSRTAPSPPRARLTQCATALHFGHRVGGRRGQSDPCEHGQVEQIVAHEGDVVVVQPELGAAAPRRSSACRARPDGRS